MSVHLQCLSSGQEKQKIAEHFNTNSLSRSCWATCSWSLCHYLLLMWHLTLPSHACKVVWMKALSENATMALWLLALCCVFVHICHCTNNAKCNVIHSLWLLCSKQLPAVVSNFQSSLSENANPSEWHLSTSPCPMLPKTLLEVTSWRRKPQQNFWDQLGFQSKTFWSRIPAAPRIFPTDSCILASITTTNWFWDTECNQLSGCNFLSL